MSALTRTAVDYEDQEIVQENAQLRAVIAALRHDVAHLRATAELWRQLYETAIRQCAARDGEKV
jgi:hypothetical protein